MRVDPNGMLDLDPYFDSETGEFLGDGGTEEIRFISKDDWDQGNLDNYGTHGADVSDAAAENVMRYYGNQTDNPIDFEYDMNISNGDDYLSTDYIDGKVTVNFDKSTIGGSIRNSSDAINLHEHETYSHGNNWIKNGSYDRNKDFWNWEKQAVSHQINSSSWKNTSVNWKAHIYKAYGKYEWIVPINQQPGYFPGIKINPMTYEKYFEFHH